MRIPSYATTVVAFGTPVGAATGGILSTRVGLRTTRTLFRPSTPTFRAYCVKLKLKDYGDSGEVHLDEEAHRRLSEYLEQEILSAEIAAQAGLPDSVSLRFSGMLFQPVPWSPTTKKGMPEKYEKFYNSPDYAVVNVPPPILFKARVGTVGRLCAIYEVVHEDPASRVGSHETIEESS